MEIDEKNELLTRVDYTCLVITIISVLGHQLTNISEKDYNQVVCFNLLKIFPLFLL